MSKAEMTTTTVSTKGQVILPKAVRQALGWEAGKKLMVMQTVQGLELKPLPVFAETRHENVFACLAYSGPPKTVDQMKAGVIC